MAVSRAPALAPTAEISMARPTFVSRFRQSLARTLFLAAALAGSAQAATQTAPVPISEPLVTVTAGLGNAMGWLGV
jgi:hypothetical protein